MRGKAYATPRVDDRAYVGERKYAQSDEVRAAVRAAATGALGGAAPRRRWVGAAGNTAASPAGPPLMKTDAFLFVFRYVLG